MNKIPSSYTVHFQELQRGHFRLTTAQILELAREDAFRFFEDPRNLFDITPDWLQFVMKDRTVKTAMFEGAEFDYTIRWLGIPLSWKTRIRDYRPPVRFEDAQLAGPYRSWSHVHLFDTVDGGTLMRDVVTYRLPFGPLGNVVHAVAVRRQLEDIFRYRAVRIEEWARGTMRRKDGNDRL
ncbi:MAG: SRPBCC family protein [Nitrospiraceae bacterium]|nr:SRPBCC family protein [Nitrospiraceae bacterium]